MLSAPYSFALYMTNYRLANVFFSFFYLQIRWTDFSTTINLGLSSIALSFVFFKFGRQLPAPIVMSFLNLSSCSHVVSPLTEQYRTLKFARIRDFKIKGGFQTSRLVDRTVSDIRINSYAWDIKIIKGFQALWLPAGLIYKKMTWGCCCKGLVERATYTIREWYNREDWKETIHKSLEIDIWYQWFEKGIKY